MDVRLESAKRETNCKESATPKSDSVLDQVCSFKLDSTSFSASMMFDD